ncbi:hypothetical protein EES45_08485 [Streptomyces sp. ADI97-07]|nr:hypothetical protein EES45_08485 [Streptomyces sp. ADI97-07]
MSMVSSSTVSGPDQFRPGTRFPPTATYRARSAASTPSSSRWNAVSAARPVARPAASARSTMVYRSLRISGSTRTWGSRWRMRRATASTSNAPARSARSSRRSASKVSTATACPGEVRAMVACRPRSVRFTGADEPTVTPWPGTRARPREVILKSFAVSRVRPAGRFFWRALSASSSSRTKSSCAVRARRSPVCRAACSRSWAVPAPRASAPYPAMSILGSGTRVRRLRRPAFATWNATRPTLSCASAEGRVSPMAYGTRLSRGRGASGRAAAAVAVGATNTGCPPSVSSSVMSGPVGSGSVMSTSAASGPVGPARSVPGRSKSKSKSKSPTSRPSQADRSKSPKSMESGPGSAGTDMSKSGMSASAPDCATGTCSGSPGSPLSVGGAVQRCRRPRPSRSVSASSVADAGAGPVPVPASRRWPATRPTASRKPSPAYRESARTSCGSAGSTRETAASQARVVSSAVVPSGAASAKSACARVHSRRDAFAAALSAVAVQAPSPAIRTRTRSSGASALAGSRSSPRSAISVRWPTESVMPPASSSRGPTVSSPVGGGGVDGRSASVSCSAIQRRSPASLGTAGAASPASVVSSRPASRAAPRSSGATPRVHSRASASSSARRASSTPAQASATAVSSPLIRSVVAAAAAAPPSAVSARTCASQASSRSVPAPATTAVRGDRALVATAVPVVVEPSPPDGVIRPQVPAVAGCPSGPGSRATVYVPVAGS